MCRPFHFQRSYEAFRAHLRAVHGLNNVTLESLVQFETYPGSRFTAIRNYTDRRTYSQVQADAQAQNVGQANNTMNSQKSRQNEPSDGAVASTSAMGADSLQTKPVQNDETSQTISKLVKDELGQAINARLPILLGELDKRIKDAMANSLPVFADRLLDAAAAYDARHRDEQNQSPPSTGRDRLKFLLRHSCPPALDSRSVEVRPFVNFRVKLASHEISNISFY